MVGSKYWPVLNKKSQDRKSYKVILVGRKTETSPTKEKCRVERADAALVGAGYSISRHPPVGFRSGYKHCLIHRVCFSADLSLVEKRFPDFMPDVL